MLKPTKKTESETELQIKAVEWLYSLKSDKFEFFATLAEAVLKSSVGLPFKRKMYLISLFKKMGLKTGIPDIVFLANGGLVFFIELKEKDGDLSENQKFRIPILEKLGFTVYICRTLDEVKKVVKDYDLL